MIETATFVCTICGESSSDICVYCTKDTCANHRCLRCKRCSDCCECEVPLTASEPVRSSIPPTVPEPLPRDSQIRSLRRSLSLCRNPIRGPAASHRSAAPAGYRPATGNAGSDNGRRDESRRTCAIVPELFAPDPTPALPEGSEEPDMNTPRPEVMDEIVESAETEEDPSTEPEH